MVFEDSQENQIKDIPIDKNHLIRREKMKLTPNSFVEKKDGKKIAGTTMIEHVDVSKNYLQEFQNIMIKRNIPAMKFIIERKKWCSDFIALETDKVIFHNNEYPHWNQIHLINLKLLSSILNYKKDFSEGLKLATHNSVSFAANFERLKKIRTFVYKSSTSKY